MRTEAPAALLPRQEGGGNDLARTGALAPAKAGALFSPADGAVLGRRRGQVLRSIPAEIVAVMARPATAKRGRLREVPL